ncbi:MAG: universal stress protein [Flavisolibacter sp.]
MKTILVPVDFSPASRKAAEYAAMLAKQLDTELFLLHVYTDPVPVMEGSIPIATIDIELQKEYRVQVQAEAGRLMEEYGVRAKGEAMTGFKGDVIKEMADELDAGLICVGRKTRKHKPIFESTALKTVRKTDIPVMVVPEGAVLQLPKHIVLAVDYKEMLHQDCVMPLFDLIKLNSASLTVLHVEKTGAEILPGEVPEKLQMDRVLSRITYMHEKLENENVEEGILKFIGSHPTDLLVMIAHRHNLFTRIFGDIHTRPVAFATAIPLLVLKNEEN